uniref:Fucosyltransferase n=1 Tax=Ciona intestinalis TaxID=7719 RepID=F6ZT75_CIOIN|nr:alpha-(1,3)-fucosyltransferase 6-like [Ciona intestinalis]|eukprot:XP_002130364.1 alpha-(1,3)-fucosyltransferase 6-like [Ciona intestinalis]
MFKKCLCRSLRCSCIFLGLAAVIFLAKEWLFFRFPIQTFEPKSVPTVTKRSSGVLLMWDHPWAVGFTSEPEGTRFGRCNLTYKRERIEEADAVIFHLTTISKKDIPWQHYRSPKQLFVFWSKENPWAMRYLYRTDFKAFDNFFNMTMTYHKNSDLYSGYGTRRNVYNMVEKGANVLDKLLSEKSKLAIWIVSNCDTMRGAVERMNYYKEIVATGFSVESCGRCFKACSQLPSYKSEQWGAEIKKYKFYFSFENNIGCKDYITEKFWEAPLWYGVIPVVWGPTVDDVIAVAPRNSFIHADWFKTAADLVEYLQYLDGNNTAYLEYFKWREDPHLTIEEMEKQIQSEHPDVEIFSAPTSSNFTMLCNAALDQTPEQSWLVSSLNQKLMGDERASCMEPGKWKDVSVV